MGQCAPTGLIPINLVRDISRRRGIPMWCGYCRQEVPGISTPDGGGTLCARCGRPLLDRGASNIPPPERNAIPENTSEDEEREAFSQASAPTGPAPWSPLFSGTKPLGEHGLDLSSLKLPPGVGSALPTWSAHESPRRSSGEQMAGPADPAGTWTETRWESPPSPPASRSGSPWEQIESPPGTRPRVERSGRWPVVLAVFAYGVFVGGFALLAWSRYAGQATDWTLAISLMLAGHLCLGGAISLWLLRLREASRKEAAEIHLVRRQLEDVQRQTRLLGTTYSSPARSFYTHWAHGASPHVLLTDLKGQLDLLAAELAERQR